ncbi:MAG: hypothetical protein K2L94_03510 [Alphaproteobacteria bacterium]|nr:hypothetical protein [Alphaproteobacteria bacterium]
MKSKPFIMLMTLTSLAACNSVHLKPGTLDKNEVIYIDRGGYQLQHSIKPYLEKRGYNVTVGYKKATVTPTFIQSNDAESILANAETGHARYIIQINEQNPKFNPFWCPFNGFWWWKFNISIADNKTAQEILGWSGRGCAHSSLRKLDRILDQLEQK